jgi:hypothetical protein
MKFCATGGIQRQGWRGRAGVLVEVEVRVAETQHQDVLRSSWR